MRSISLILVPGTGHQTVQVATGTTLAQFAATHNLNGRQLIVDGEGVPPSQWGAVTLDTAVEIFATGSVKGN